MNSGRSITERRKIVYVNLMTLVACIMLILLAEGAVRVRALLKYGYVWGVQSILLYDRDIELRVLKAGTEFGPIQINSLGFRGPDIDRSKPEGRVRIAFLGGSTTFCAEVSSNETAWPHLVWQIVSLAKADADIDYVNAGVPGYGTTASLKNLRFRVAELDPDVIVIYHATNDLSDNSFHEARDQGLVKQRTGQQKYWLSNYSLLAHLVEMNLRIMRNQRNSKAAIGTLEVDAEKLAAPFRQDLTRLVEVSKQTSAIVVLVTFSSQMRKEQPADQKLSAAASSLYYMPYMSVDGLIEAFEKYNDVIRDVAKESGVLMMDAEDAVPGDSIHFNDSVHFTDVGSRMMAEYVAKGLLESDQFLKLINSVAVTQE